MRRQQFGGNWTNEKLKRVKKYLEAYTKILNGKGYKYAYIDAFAGTGYREMRAEGSKKGLLFPELAREEPQQFLEGSVRISLKVEPGFDSYIFIERDSDKAAQLKAMIEADFPQKISKTDVLNEDANCVLTELCKKDWSKHRAVLFLDPFGMQVEWSTIQAIANTKAIDLWTLFPLGIAVNRMLTRSGDISTGWSKRLDILFGTQNWYKEFYERKNDIGLFGTNNRIEKKADYAKISSFYLKHLKSEFEFVAPLPLQLVNSKGNPLYLLYFAAGNPKGGVTAIKIAQHLLKR